jgi:hypothetical protein
MNKRQYTVKVRVPQDELAELVGWVAAMSGAILLSSDLIPGRESDKKAKGSNTDNTDPRLGRKNNIDPRLMFEPTRPENSGTKGRLDIEASLARLGLDAEYLRKTKTKAGTAEHSIKMAMASRERHLFTDKLKV